MKTKVKLKDIASYSKGSQINGDKLIENGMYEYLNGGINPSGKWDDYNTPGGTVTISEGGNSCGYVNFMENPFWCGAHCYYLYDTVQNVRYLYYALKSQQDRLMKIRSGACMPNIKKADLGEFDLFFDTDKVEQQGAVDVLQRAERIIADRQYELHVLEDLKKARFVEMFGDPVSNEKGWPTRPLLSMGSCKNGMNFHYDDSGVKLNCLGVGDFKDYSIIADTATLPMVSLNEIPSSEYLLQDDDIVFVRSNGNKKMVGRSVAVYPGSVPTTFSGFCIRFRRNDDSVITPYLLRVLKAESMRQKMYGRGANIQNLNQQTLSSLDIPVPPKTLQEEFAAFIIQVDKSKLPEEYAILNLRLLYSWH